MWPCLAESKNAGLEYGKGGEKKEKWSAAQKDWREPGVCVVCEKEMSFELRVSLPHLTGRRFEIWGAPIKSRAAFVEIKNGLMRRSNRGRNLRLSSCNSSRNPTYPAQANFNFPKLRGRANWKSPGKGPCCQTLYCALQLPCFQSFSLEFPEFICSQCSRVKKPETSPSRDRVNRGVIGQPGNIIGCARTVVAKWIGKRNYLH